MTTSPLMGIAAVAKQTGLSAHTLRAWERRYGFPAPTRVSNGERVYDAEQVGKLRLLRTLGDRGHRPAKIVRLSAAELQQLVAQRDQDQSSDARAPDFDAYFHCLLSVSVGELRRRLRAALVRQGLARFVIETLEPLQREIGKWGESGRIDVGREHLFSEQVERLLRDAMAPLDEFHPTKVVLTTFPSERHGLGLLMVEALLRLEGAACIPIGVETPPAQMARLVAQSSADIVALSFSAAYADPTGRRLLSGLRNDLPAHIAVWASGEGAVKIARALRGVSVFGDLDGMVTEFRQHYPLA